jgi:hypothetical protein
MTRPARSACSGSEKARLLGFLQVVRQLKDSRCEIAASLNSSPSIPAYRLSDLRNDLGRFVFLLGGSDGEQFCGP